ncbi:hypothetical protein [Burkholderia ubonensis]|uniref:hypothetical protein n=1 Tax=Burkholderia ubonensis TaxID=101571 RepID=UPI000AE0E032|nr:hypothetical protein [Burkholderia ubonensis]
MKISPVIHEDFERAWKLCRTGLLATLIATLTLGFTPITDVAPGAASAGNVSVAIAAEPNGHIVYNWWTLGQAGHWYELADNMRTDASPAAALIGNYLFVVIKGPNNTLYLNQGELGHPFVGWQSMGFQSNVAPGAASAGNVSVAVAARPDGHISYNWWTLGHAGHWYEPADTMRTDAAPAAALVGNYLFVIVKGLDNTLYLNQGELGRPSAGWQSMGFQSNVAPGAASAGNVSVAVAARPDGRIFYNWWVLGQSGHWNEVTGSVRTDTAPAVALVGNYLFVMVRGRDGKIYLNQGHLDKPFVGWHLLQG